MTGFLFQRRDFISGGFLTLLAMVSPELFAAEKISYEYLQRNLYPKTSAEEAYLHKVVEAVERGTLPAKLVYMAIKNTSRRGKSKRIYYFSTTLSILAKKSGIKTVPVLSQGTPNVGAGEESEESKESKD